MEINNLEQGAGGTPTLSKDKIHSPIIYNSVAISNARPVTPEYIGPPMNSMRNTPSSSHKSSFAIVNIHSSGSKQQESLKKYIKQNQKKKTKQVYNKINKKKGPNTQNPIKDVKVEQVACKPKLYPKINAKKAEEV